MISALKARLASLELRGIGGPELANLGLESACDIHDLSVMAVEDLIRKLPGALRVRRQLLRDFRSDPPDLFLGIDSPDFNLTLERRLRLSGIRPSPGQPHSMGLAKLSCCQDSPRGRSNSGALPIRRGLL